jgi:NDP-sugar pyrophosphorylase family protein
LLCEEDRQLYGLLTDGDIRRAFLRSVSFNSPCGAIACRDPIVAPSEVTQLEAIHLMDHSREFVINHLPVVDKTRRVVGLLLRSDLVPDNRLPISAVIMAGGFGTRLFPLTQQVPKPMLPAGDRPLLQRTIERLKDAGIHRVHVSTHYLHEKITSHFGNGESFGVDLSYVTEDHPLGTAGALNLMDQTKETLLVINGDILTKVCFRDMLEHHRQHGAEMTVGLRQSSLEIPFTVMDCTGIRVINLREKPQLHFLFNAGIYLLEPSVRQYIPHGQRFDMTELIQRLLEKDRIVIGFPIVEYWRDIGQHADYAQAQEDIRNGRL